MCLRVSVSMLLCVRMSECALDSTNVCDQECERESNAVYQQMCGLVRVSLCVCV